MPCRHPGCLKQFDFDDIAYYARKRYIEGISTIVLLCDAKTESEKTLIVLASVPFALVGVAWAFWATDTHMDSIAWIGLMILIGIVVNHGIVLVDRLQRIQREGTPAHEALVRAGQDRLRPIVMTAATTVLGLLPMALGLSGYSRVFGPFAAAIVFGLLSASLLTLFVVPALYLTLEDLRALRGIGRRSRPARTAGLRPASVSGTDS